MQSADLVACVSEEVRQEVARFGVAEDRTIVAPMGVDADRFSPDADGSEWLSQSKLATSYDVICTSTAWVCVCVCAGF